MNALAPGDASDATEADDEGCGCGYGFGFGRVGGGRVEKQKPTVQYVWTAMIGNRPRQAR